MSLNRIILLPFLLLISFMVYSVYSFDYSKINSYPLPEEKSFLTKISDSLNEIKNKIFNLLANEQTNTNETFISKIELIKVDNVVVMNGLFKNEEQSYEMMNKLNINRLGTIQYNNNVNFNEQFLINTLYLIAPFKDLFQNDSKINILGNNIHIEGRFIDDSYKDLFSSIVKRSSLNITMDIKESEKIIPEEKIEEKAIQKEVLNLKQIQSQINNILENQKINFERRSVNVTSQSMESIKKIAEVLEKYKEIKIEISGHTDSKGSLELNKKISQDRAISVKEILLSLGIDENRLKAVGYGPAYPIEKEDKNGLSLLNRRVEFNIIEE